MEVMAYGESSSVAIQDHSSLACSFEFDYRIFNPQNQTTCASGFHREMLGSLLALTGQQEYKERAYLSALLGSTDPEP